MVFGESEMCGEKLRVVSDPFEYFCRSRTAACGSTLSLTIDGYRCLPLYYISVGRNFSHKTETWSRTTPHVLLARAFG